MDIRLCNCRIHPLFAFVLTLALLLDTSGVLFFSLLATLMHESGHLVLLRLWKRSVRQISFTPFGIQIEAEQSLVTGYREELLIAAGGPAVNILLFLACWPIFLSCNVQVVGLFAVANLVVGAINLMPISGMDGCDITLCILRLLALDEPSIIATLRLLSFLFAFMLSLVTFLLILQIKLNISLIFLLVYVLFVILQQEQALY